MRKFILALGLFWAALGHASSFIVVVGGVSVAGGSRIVVAVTSAPAQSVLFTAADTQYIDLGNTYRYPITQPFSVFAWVYTTNTGTSLVFGNQDVLHVQGWQLTIRSGAVAFRIGGATGEIRQIGSVNVADGRWHLIGATYDGSNAATGIALWIDAVQDTDTTPFSVAVTGLAYNRPTQISSDGTGGSFGPPFDGYIAGVMAFDTTISSGQITSLYNSGNLKDLTGTADLTNWYAMGNASGDTDATIKDQIGGNDGTVVNGIAYKQFAPFAFTQKFFTQVKNNTLIPIPRGDYLYLPYYNNGVSAPYDAPDLQTWSKANPISPTLVNTIATTYPTNNALMFPAISGNFGIVPFWKSFTVEMLDLSHAAAPSYSSTFGVDLTNSSTAVINGNVAYIIGNTEESVGSAAIVDLTTTPPTVLSYFTIPTDTFGTGPRAVLKGTNLFISGHETSNLQVFDVSNPTSPVAGTSLSLAIPPTAVTLDGNYLYVSAETAIYVIDISTPSSPTNVHRIDTNARPSVLAISSNRKLLISPNNLGGTIQAISIYDPTNAFVAGSYSVGNDGNGNQMHPNAATLVGDDLYITLTSVPSGGTEGQGYGFLSVFQL